MKQTNYRIFNLLHIFPILICLLSVFQAYSQTTGIQKVDYSIMARLDTSQQKIEAQATVFYHNNAAESLTEIWFHLWANAHSSKNTSLSKELIEAHNPSMYFLKQKELGGYTDISFRMGEHELTPQYSDDEKQIVRLTLNRPLPAGAIAEINIRYSLKIPKNILGYGYDDGQFILANWYPKAAVYRDGKWEVQVLNSQNLFSSDVGKYHLTLFVPDNYSVISSGNSVSVHLAVSEEWEQMSEKNGYKKLSFAHPGTKDFAWIANKQLPVFPQLVTLDNGKKFLVEVTTDHNVLFEKNLDQFMPFLKDLIEFTEAKMPGNLPESFRIFCSEKINHPVAFAGLITTNLYTGKHVDGEFNFTAREKLAQHVMLMGLTDRIEENPIDKPWMYLGLSSYYFTRFLDEKYPGKKKRSYLFIPMAERIKWYIPDCVICTKPTVLSLPAYHCKDDLENFLLNPVAVQFNYLEKIMGQQVFDQTMKGYFGRKRNEPEYRESLKKYFSILFGDRYLWFFDGMLANLEPMPYEIKNIERQDGKIFVEINNAGKFNPPYMIALRHKGVVVDTLFQEGHSGQKTMQFDDIEANYAEIDPFGWFNKTIALRQSAYIRKPNWEKIYTRWPLNFPYPGRTNFTVDPVPGYNVNDGFLAGGVIKIKSKNTLSRVIPLYGFRSKTMNGYLSVYHYPKTPDGRIITLGMTAQSFHRMWAGEQALRYYRISPLIAYTWKDQNSCEHKKTFYLQGSLIGDQIYGSAGIEHYNRYVTRFSFYDIKKTLINPYEFTIGLEHQYYNLYEKRHYLMVNARFETSYMYKKNRYIHARLYWATYLYNSHSNSTNTLPGTLSLIGYNMNDYAYDYLTFFDRSAQDGFWSRQISMHTGGFKTAISNAYGVGQSNRFVASVNLKMDLPFGTMIKPFFDFGVYGYLPTVSEGYSTKTLYSAGLVFEILKDKFEIYLPLINSKEIEDKYRETYEKPFWGKFSFSFVDFNLIF